MNEIKTSEKTVLTLRDVAEVVGMSADTLRKQARTDPSLLGFRCVIAEGNVRIPRLAFIRFIEGGDVP